MKSAKQQQKQLQEASSRKYKERPDLFNVWNADYAENATSVPNKLQLLETANMLKKFLGQHGLVS